MDPPPAPPARPNRPARSQTATGEISRTPPPVADTPSPQSPASPSRPIRSVGSTLPLGRPPPFKDLKRGPPSLSNSTPSLSDSSPSLPTRLQPDASPASPSRPRPPPPPPTSTAADAAAAPSSSSLASISPSSPSISPSSPSISPSPPSPQKSGFSFPAVPPPTLPPTVQSKPMLRQNRRSRSLLALKDAVIQAQLELSMNQSTESGSSQTDSSCSSGGDQSSLPPRPMRKPSGSVIKRMAEAGGGGEGGAPRRPTDAYMARKNVVSTIPEERRLIITELVMSELKYVQDLELIRTLFLEPIRSNKLLELMDFMMLFSNIEIIEQTNRELLKTLQDLVGSSTDILALCIGDVFLRQIEELLPVYTPYCLNQAQSVETYDRLMSKKGPFSDFVKKMMVEPKAQGLPMMSYLIKPVQRLCKYPLLLRELLNKTNNSHPDRKPLERALLQTNSLVVQVNESKRSAENLRKLLQVDRLVDNRKNLKIVTPGRWFIKEGKLVKVTHKRHQERQFFLFSDMLMWCKPIPIKNSFEFKGFVFLNRSALSDVATRGVEHGFHLTRSDTQKRYLMYAKDAKEKKEWCIALLTAIQESWMTEAEAAAVPTSSPGPSPVGSFSPSSSSSPPSIGSPAATVASPAASAVFTIQQTSSLTPEDVLTMVDVENRIAGFTNTSQTRKLLREGPVVIKGKSRYLFMFNDIAIVTSKKSAKVYNKKLQINLADLSVIHKGPFVLEWIRPKLPPLEIHHTSSTTVQEWIADLKPLILCFAADLDPAASSVELPSEVDSRPKMNPYATIRGVPMNQMGFSYMI